MFDLKFVRDNPEKVQEGLKKEVWTWAWKNFWNWRKNAGK